MCVCVCVCVCVCALACLLACRQMGKRARMCNVCLYVMYAYVRAQAFLQAYLREQASVCVCVGGGGGGGGRGGVSARARECERLRANGQARAYV